MNIERTIVTSKDLKKSGIVTHYFVEDILKLTKRCLEKYGSGVENVIIFRDKLKPDNIFSDGYILADSDEKAKGETIKIIKDNIKNEIDNLENIVSKFENDILNRTSISKFIRLVRNKINGYNEVNMIEEVNERIKKLKKIYSEELNIDFHFSDEEKNKTYIVPNNYDKILKGMSVYCSYFNMGEKNGILKYNLSKIENKNKSNNFYSHFFIDINVENKGQYYLNFESEAEFKDGEKIESKRCYISYDKDTLSYTVTDRFSGHEIFETVEKALEHNLSVIEKMKEKAKKDADLIIKNI